MIVDQAANPVVDPIGIVEIPGQIVSEAQRAVLDIVKPAVQRHALQGKLAQVDIAAAIPSGQIMVGILAHLFLQAVLIHRQVVLAEVVEPFDRIAAAIHPRTTRCAADREMHFPTRKVQVFRDLTAGLATAHHQDFARRQLVGILVLRTSAAASPDRSSRSARRGTFGT